MNARFEAIRKVVLAVEARHFVDVSEDDLAAADNEAANRLYRQWIAGGRVQLPADAGYGDPCVDEVLVRITTRVLSEDGRRFRATIEHEGNLQIFAGDTIFVRRSKPVRDPEAGF